MEMGAPKRFVYILESESQPNRYYTGLTSNLAARLDAHNAGRCKHTASGRPWRLDVVVTFADERRADGASDPSATSRPDVPTR